MLRRCLPFLLGLAAFAGGPPAPDPARGMLPALRVFTGQDGLPENAVMGLALGPGRRLWVATQDGAAAYDGRAWRKEDLPGRARSNFLRCVAAAPDGTLWFGRQDGGVAQLRAGQWTSLEEGMPAAAQMVDALAWADGALYAAADHGGLGRWDGAGWTWMGIKDGLPSEAVRALAASDGALWVGTGAGLARVVKGRVEGLELPGKPITVLAALPEGLTAGMSDGTLWRRGAAGWEPLPSPPGLAQARITALARTEDAKGHATLWIGTDGAGLAAHDEQGWRRYSLGHGLPSDSVWSLQPEGAPTESLWIGTDAGLARLRFGGWSQAGSGQGLSDPGVYGIVVPTAPGLAGTAWFGTRTGLFRFEAGVAKPVPLPAGSGVFGMTEWQGELYAASRGGGLFKTRDGVRFTAVPTPFAGANARRLEVMADERGETRLWVVTGDRGLWHSDGSGWTKVPGLPTESLHAALRTSDGALWVGTERAGLVRVAEGRARVFDLASGLPNMTVMSLQEGRRDGKPWLFAGTEGGGLLMAPLAAEPRWQILSTATDPALPNDTVYQLRQDREGRLYAFTNQGVARLAFASGRVKVETFGVEDGLPGPEFNGGASAVDAQGRIWGGNSAGAVMFDPEAELPAGPLPRLSLDRTTVNGDPRSLADGTRLAWRDRALRFDFRLATLFKNGEVRYQTQLLGLEDRPSPWSAEASREFPGLAPGAYTFRIRARAPDGRVTPPLDLAFTLPPPPWASPWAKALYAVLGLLLVLGLMRLRLAALKRRTEELETQVAARTREVENQKHLIEEQNRRIAGFAERAGLAQHDLLAWAKGIGREVAEALSAEEVGLFMVQEEGLRALGESGVHAPTLETLQAVPTFGEERRRHAEPVAQERRHGQVVPVRGSGGELLGGVVVKGAPPMGELEQQMVAAFAAQMGAVLELHRTRKNLQAARARQAEAKASLQAKGVELLHLCPACRRCYPDAVTHCPEDGAALEMPRLLPLVIEGRYRLERLLGEGGMGLVFGAQDERLGREVAVKLLKPELYAASVVQARFQQEARMLAALAHPGIIAIHDSGELEDGHAFLVMEYLEGESL
ncbi:MAG TPA: protein kinase, partial [Holophagaceae bacterium]|nr:protein kinase [Holophagaceae bacterium]